MRWEPCIAGPPEDPCRHLPAARMGHVAGAIGAVDSAWGEELFVLHGGIGEDKRALRLAYVASLSLARPDVSLPAGAYLCAYLILQNLHVGLLIAASFNTTGVDHSNGHHSSCILLVLCLNHPNAAGTCTSWRWAADTGSSLPLRQAAARLHGLFTVPLWLAVPCSSLAATCTSERRRVCRSSTMSGASTR